MAASDADRNRASRIRKKGNLAIQEERDWLRLYEANRAPTVFKARPLQAAPATAPIPSPSPAQPVATERHLRLVPPPPAGHVDIDFGRPQDSAAPPGQHIAPIHHGGACPAGPDCPRCRAVAGAIQCGTTGERVWPKMTEDGARGMAGALLGMIALVARMFGKDVSVTAEETNRLAMALRETIYQRAGAMGAGDDLYALGWILLLFGAKVYQAPRLPAKGT